ncbi:MAG TPA: hypothetical protein VGR35_04140 [Tepidisphaeraceae bacterium]|nr:hypothetical protein [Tepidisphaeraceae bacterium]
MTLPTLVPDPTGNDLIVFYDASWDFYEAMLREHDERPRRQAYLRCGTVPRQCGSRRGD